MREIPPDICPMIDITHSDHAALFEEYKLKWYGIPALSAQVLEIGGIDYTCVPFNGWYMSTEISARNFTDPYRYDLAQKMASSLGLSTERNRSLWRDKIQVILNEAVLQSFSNAKVTIVDPYSATDSFIQHHKTEIKDRGFIAGDWVWLVPPAAGGMSELFHLEMINAYLTPNFKARMMSLADLMKRSGLIILP